MATQRYRLPPGYAYNVEVDSNYDVVAYSLYRFDERNDAQLVGTYKAWKHLVQRMRRDRQKHGRQG